jgi:hypothetical protein
MLQYEISILILVIHRLATIRGVDCIAQIQISQNVTSLKRLRFNSFTVERIRGCEPGSVPCPGTHTHAVKLPAAPPRLAPRLYLSTARFAIIDWPCVSFNRSILVFVTTARNPVVVIVCTYARVYYPWYNRHVQWLVGWSAIYSNPVLNQA